MGVFKKNSTSKEIIIERKVVNSNIKSSRIMIDLLSR
jgi:hypothetical protein